MTDCKPAPLFKHVTATFQHGRLSFDIGAPDVTLAQIAQQVCVLGEMHSSLPLSVDVQRGGRKSSLNRK